MIVADDERKRRIPMYKITYCSKAPLHGCEVSIEKYGNGLASKTIMCSQGILNSVAEKGFSLR